ncbi:hypothetical protein ACIO3O_34270 [Streptomyces sp. NPDC087440]|uniref:hypothetical protein n=1 Tax=Streptomyces sp. NPDC087440 TaxID=3365790 RepID=UPI003814AF92
MTSTTTAADPHADLATASRTDVVTDAYLRTPALADAVRAAPYPPVFRDCWGARTLDRPLFVPETELHGFAQDLGDVISLLESIPDLLFGGDVGRYCDAVGIDPVRAAVLRRFHLGSLVRYGRADAYHDGTGFRLLEINMASNLGGTDRSEMQRALLEVPAFRDFADEHGLGHVHTGERIRDTLLARTRPGAHRYAVVCGRAGLEKYGHLLHGFTEMMARLGLDFRLGELDQVTERGDRVLLDGTEIDVVLRFFNVDDVCWDPAATARADILFRAHEEGRLFLWSPINGSLFSNKGALALLSDPASRPALSAGEAAVVDRVLPETFLLTPDAVDRCRAERAELILKPLRDFGGRGIVAGWRLDDREWHAVLDASVRQQYVVQRRVVPCAEPVAAQDTGEVRDWHAVWGVFFTPDGYAGTDVRAAPVGRSTVINYGSNPSVRTSCAFTYAS